MAAVGEATAERKAKDAIRTRTGALSDIIVNGDITTIANLCEQEGIITQAVKNKLTSDKINKDDSARSFDLLNAVRGSFAYNTSNVMDDFLCIIYRHGGPGGVAITQEIVKDCSGCLKFEKYPKLTTPTRVTTRAEQEDLSRNEEQDSGSVTQVCPKQEIQQSTEFESLQEVSDDDDHISNQISTDYSAPVYVYPNKHRGLVLVICNERWEDDPSKQRDGSSADIAAIRQTFEPLRYKVIVQNDKSSVEMKDYFKNLDKVFEMGFSPGDCFICFILSHGNKFGIEGTDGHHVSVRTLAQYVQSDKCLSLKGKPKLFFVQACRGNALPNEVKLDGQTTGAEEGNRIMTDSSSPTAIPPEADFFFGYSTVCFNAALRGDILGSHYIQVLCKAISDHSKKLPLYDIVMLVHQTLATEDKYSYPVPGTVTKYRQMAEMVSTLRGRFFFKK